MEEARSEYFAERGISIKELAAAGILFVVARKIHRVKIEVEQLIKNQYGKVVCAAKTLVVCVDKNIEPKVIPVEVRKKF
jgi:acyl-CoA thioesterase FadM